jgi:hypothetical protein
VEGEEVPEGWVLLDKCGTWDMDMWSGERRDAEIIFRRI